MNTTPTTTDNTEAINFNFDTTYLGKEINLRVIHDHDRYTVSHNDRPIGHIKLGHVRHTWYVVDSNYVAPYLVDEIGNRIEAQYKLSA